MGGEVSMRQCHSQYFLSALARASTVIAIALKKVCLDVMYRYIVCVCVCDWATKCGTERELDAFCSGYMCALFKLNLRSEYLVKVKLKP